MERRLPCPSLPPNPNLEQLRKRSKTLLKAYRGGDVSVCETLRLLHRFAGSTDAEILQSPVTLHDVQFSLALSYGFKDWKELRQHIESRQSVSEELEGEIGQTMSPATITPEDLTGPQKGAIFLLTVGEELAKALYEKADEKKQRLVAKYLRKAREVPSDVLRAVTDEAIRGLEKGDAGLSILGSDWPAISHQQKISCVREICQTHPEKMEQLAMGWAGVEPVASKPAPQGELISLGVGYGLLALVNREQGGTFLDKVRSIRRHFASVFGMVVPPIHIRDDFRLPPSSYEILLKGVRVAGAELVVECCLATDTGDVSQKMEGTGTVHPASNLPAIWIPAERKEEAILSGYVVTDCATVMATHLEGVIIKLIQEQVLNNLAATVDTFTDFAPTTKDPDLLAEHVRHELSRAGSLWP